MGLWAVHLPWGSPSASLGWGPLCLHPLHGERHPGPGGLRPRGLLPELPGQRPPGDANGQDGGSEWEPAPPLPRARVFLPGAGQALPE